MRTSPRRFPATVTIANTVLAGNRAQPVAGSGAPGLGGAIFARAYVDITMTDSRMVDNHLDVPNPPDPGLFIQAEPSMVTRSR